MVYFTCNICGESLKKKQVDRHCVTKCRNAWFFTCMDCGKTFEGFEYEKHTTCMTETEKYQGFYLKNKGKVEENNGSEVKINTKRKKMEVGEEIKINGEEVSKEPKWEKYLKHGEWGGWKRTIKRLLKDVNLCIERSIYIYIYIIVCRIVKR